MRLLWREGGSSYSQSGRVFLCGSPELRRRAAKCDLCPILFPLRPLRLPSTTNNITAHTHHHSTTPPPLTTTPRPYTNSDFLLTVVKGPAVLVGNSIGGFISASVAADYPDLVTGLVLVNSAGPIDAKFDIEAHSRATKKPPSAWLARALTAGARAAAACFSFCFCARGRVPARGS